ncbi:MAG: V-type ATP synthase subunit K [Bacillota bacterium]|nr:V-type ATP synthase subunit K [Bacillota bacterium]
MIAILALAFFAKTTGGLALAVLGAATAAALAGIGSSLGVGIAGEASAGVTAEDPEKFGKLLLLQALPGTQGIYGFLAAFLVMFKVGFFSGTIANLTVDQGWQIFFSCLPVGLSCLVSGIYQGRASVASINLVAKRPEESGKALIFPAMVETYAVLGLLATILLVMFGVKI